MYHRATIQSRFEALIARDRANPRRTPEDRLVPIDVSIDERLRRSAYLMDLLGDDGTLRRRLRPDEQRWVRHEKLRSMIDFEYYLGYAFINDYTNKLVRFVLNTAQRMVLKVWSDMEAAELAIMLLQLKARQLGVTTLTELAIAHRVQFYPDVNAVVASADPVKSDKMFGMVTLCWNKMPWFLMPRTTRDSAKLIEFGQLNSGISLQHGAQVNGIARGTTPSAIHLSEVASFVDAKTLIEASLLRAVHETPWTLMIMESTAEGMYGYWPEKWRECVEGWPKQQSRFCPMFLPWFIGRDLYPTEAWIRKQPIPVDWTPSPLVVAHAERARLYVKANPMLRDMLGADWLMPREQMWYYEAEYNSARTAKRLNLFLSEMPADELEAFQSMRESAFEPEVVAHYRNVSGAREPWGTFGFAGKQDDIPLRMQPAVSQIDTSRPRITVRCARHSALAMDVDLVPLKFDGYSNGDNKLYIYEPPDREGEFGLGIDTAYGVGRDASAIEGIRKAKFGEGPRQVCEYASKYVSAFNAWPLALALATLYSPNKQARAVIECRGTGDVVQLEMRKRGWANFHPWTQYDNRRIRPDQGAKIGWFTNHASRQLLMDALISCLNDGWFYVYSPFFVNEMASLSRDESKQSFSADAGANDDRIMSAGMVLISMHILEMRGFQARRMAGDRMPVIASSEVHENPYEDPVYDPGPQGRDTGHVPRELKGFMRTMKIAHLQRSAALHKRGFK